MLIIKTVADLRAALNKQSTTSFVPTMGNLHAGHIRLVEIAKKHAQQVVVSIFVNPLQFGANEDLASYPRTLEADCQKLESAGCDIVFVPDISEIYSEFDGKNLNQTINIALPPIADTLCGVSRPGHFAGVATVVLKLFNIVQPDIAVFGKKDFQQLFIINQLVKQFNLPIKIMAGETVREASGLAMSSRNGYLDSEQHMLASQLNQALQDIAHQLKSGNQAFIQLEKSAAQQLIALAWQVDYISIRSAATLQQATSADRHVVILGAAKISNKNAGKTRLIDNIECDIDA